MRFFCFAQLPGYRFFCWLSFVYGLLRLANSMIFQQISRSSWTASTWRKFSWFSAPKTLGPQRAHTGPMFFWKGMMAFQIWKIKTWKLKFSLLFVVFSWTSMDNLRMWICSLMWRLFPLFFGGANKLHTHPAPIERPVLNGFISAVVRTTSPRGSRIWWISPVLRWTLLGLILGCFFWSRFRFCPVKIGFWVLFR